MKDPQFLLMLTEDVMKLSFISILDTKALVTDYSFLPLHLSPHLHFSPFSSFQSVYREVSSLNLVSTQDHIPLPVLEGFAVVCSLLVPLSHVPFSLATSNRFLFLCS